MQNLISNNLGKIVQIQECKNNQLELAYVMVAFLKFFHSWPLGNSDLKSNIYYAIILLYSNIVVIALWAHMIYCILDPDFQFNDIAVDLGILGVATGGYQYCLHLYKHRHLAKKLIEDMGDYRVYEKPPGMELTDAWFNAVYKTTMIAMLLLAPVLFSYLIVQTCELNDLSCGLVYPAYLPIMLTPIRRKVFLVFQITSAWSYAILGTTCLWVGLHLGEIIIEYMKHLQLLIQQTLSFSDWRERRWHVIHAVKYHQRIIDLHNNYSILVKGIFVVHAVITPVIMAMMIHTFIIAFQLQCFVIFLLYTMTLFVVCFTGQRMINESEKLTEMIYDAIPWDGDVEAAKNMLLFLLRSQRPLRISASLTYCGFELFLIALKTSYSFLTLIESTS